MKESHNLQVQLTTTLGGNKYGLKVEHLIRKESLSLSCKWRMMAIQMKKPIANNIHNIRFLQATEIIARCCILQSFMTFFG